MTAFDDIVAGSGRLNQRRRSLEEVLAERTEREALIAFNKIRAQIRRIDGMLFEEESE